MYVAKQQKVGKNKNKCSVQQNLLNCKWKMNNCETDELINIPDILSVGDKVSPDVSSLVTLYW